MQELESYGESMMGAIPMGSMANISSNAKNTVTFEMTPVSVPSELYEPYTTSNASCLVCLSCVGFLCVCCAPPNEPCNG
jgi:hypothetical protein